jgi:DUF4097 and DUF4098 domain-containing protein YvlB
VSLLAGGITVKGYAGKEVVVEAKTRDEGKPAERNPAPAGMKRIPNLSTGLTVEEEDNVISIGTGMMNRAVDISLQVPMHTSLKLKSINDGDIRADQVAGDLEVNDINGAVTLNQISGSVVAHALNGEVKATIASVDPNKPMSFSSLNGDIDVTLPPDVKANVVMKTDQGEIYSDFDVTLDQAAAKPAVEGAEGKGGKYRLKIDRTLHGKINGGGPEFQFKTFNGNIYIRRSGK